VLISFGTIYVLKSVIFDHVIYVKDLISVGVKHLIPFIRGMKIEGKIHSNVRDAAMKLFLK
jgi:hypothetical protein